MSTLALKLLSQNAERTLLGKLVSAWRAFRDCREQRAAARALSGMDDHLLKDIGVTRLEIRAAEYGLRTWKS
jgi:uncharacterized protein YjiS (DUF1127 family)